MICLARSEILKDYFQTRIKFSELANRFIGGKTEEEALKKCHGLMNKNIYSSLFYLGEYVTNLGIVHKTVDSLIEMAELLSKNELDIHISVDPTQIGHQIDKTICSSNLQKIASMIKIKATQKLRKSKYCFLMIDMEDASISEDTITYYNTLVEMELPVALTLQAYLYRTEQDLKYIINRGGIVRLVKGAFGEEKDIALTSKKDIDEAFYKLSKLMLSSDSKKKGFYPIFATHDDNIINKINLYAEENSWGKKEYEFEMLYGVRVDYQNELVKQGYKLRLYLPYGEDWWPYAIRRVGENPKNIKYLFRNLKKNSDSYTTPYKLSASAEFVC